MPGPTGCTSGAVAIVPTTMSPRRVAVVVLAAVIGLLLAAALPDSTSTRPTTTAGVRSAATRPVTEVTSPLALAPAPDPQRPAVLLPVTEPSPSLPNPFVLPVDDGYLMFTTEARDAVGAKQNVPVLRSEDLRSWHFVRDALPDVGAWTTPEATWAPDVVRANDGWVLYYTARLADHRPPTQCIGAAVASVAEGPYRPAAQPIVCQLDRNGSIDPRTFRAGDGTLWLHWKSDDNADVEGTSTSTIYAQRLGADGTTLIGEPTRILEVSQPWEGRIVEAPDMIEAAGHHWLFYSGNWFNQPDYAIGVARCDSPAGPCTKVFDRPWLASNAQGSGPGEGSLFQDHTGRWRLVYSPVAQQYRSETDRPIALATVGVDEHGPYLADSRAGG